jgi:HlyD family secretion protein
MSASLDDLKIDRRQTPRSGPGLLWILLALAVGAAGSWAVSRLVYHKGDVREDLPRVTLGIVLPAGSGPGEGKALFTAGGWIEPAFPAPKTVTSLVAGRIEKIHVQDGQEVAKGEVLVEIYSRDYRERLAKVEAELKVLESRLTVDRAKLKLLEAGYRTQDISEARSRLAELTAEAEKNKKIAGRSEKLAAGGAVSREQAQIDRTAYEKSKARVEAQKALLSKLEEGIRQEEIAAQRAVVAHAESRVRDGEARRRIAQTNLEYTVIRSPLDAVVLRSFREIGDYVNPVVPVSSRIVWLYDPRDIWVRVDVAQAHLAKVTVGAPVSVRVDASPRAYEGVVVRKDPYGSLAKNTVEVKVKITGPDALLHPEMTARITFLAPGRKETGDGPKTGRALTVPSRAVQRTGGETYVFVYRDGRVYRTAVKVGAARGDRVDVVEGLRAREQVVTSQPESLAHGQEVSPGGTE